MNGNMFRQRKLLTVYFVLVYVIAWFGSFVIIGPKFFSGNEMQPTDLMLIGVAMLLPPCLLGIIMTYLADSRPGLQDLFGRMKNWRVGAKWYAAPLIFPILILACLLPLAALVSTEFRPVFFPVGIIIGLLAGFLEEVGWMGFAYPKMKSRQTALSASLKVGVIHVLWHFGADYLGASSFRAEYFLPRFLFFCVAMVAMRIILVWVYENTQSVWMAQLMHASSSGSLATLVSMSISPANDTLFHIVYSIALWIVALVIIVKNGRDLKSQATSSVKTEEIFTDFPTLETKRLVLQEFQPEFAADIFKILSNGNVNQFEPREPFTELSQAERYVKARLFITREKREGIIWAIALRGSAEIIGDIGYTPHHESNAEIGFKLHRDYWNKGLITEAIKAVDHFLFTENGINRIEATTRQENKASVRVLAKNGFQKEGTLRECEQYQGEFYDLVMYSLLKREYQE